MGEKPPGTFDRVSYTILLIAFTIYVVFRIVGLSYAYLKTIDMGAMPVSYIMGIQWYGFVVLISGIIVFIVLEAVSRHNLRFKIGFLTLYAIGLMGVLDLWFFMAFYKVLLINTLVMVGLVTISWKIYFNISESK